MRQPVVLADRYRIVRALGQGATARTFLAHDDSRRNREVAVKVLEGDASPDGRLRLKREFTALSRIAHPGFPKALDFGVSGTRCFYTTEFVEGEDLGRFLRRRTNRGPEVALQIVVQVAGALDHLRRSGIAHGDLHPGNILIRREGNSISVKLIDLGLAGPDASVAEDLRSFGRHLLKLIPEGETPIRLLLDRLVTSKPGLRIEEPDAVLAAARTIDPGVVELVGRDLRIFGRDRELKSLGDLLDSALARTPGHRVVSVHGESGSGRTAILDQARIEAQTRGFVVGASGAADGGRTPYEQARSALEMLGASGFPREILERRFGDASELRLGVTRALLAAAEDVPLALIFDDLDMGDRDSRALAEHLAQVLPMRNTSRLVLVASARTAPFPRERALAIELAPLERSDLSALARSWAGGATPSAGLIDELSAASRGHAGLARELLDASSDRVTVSDGALRLLPESRLALTEDRKNSVGRQVTELDAVTRETLEFLALLTRPLPLKEIRAVTGFVKAAEALETLLDLGWADAAGGGWKLTSAFLRRSIEETIPEARRANLHLQIARGLENCGGQVSFEKLESIAHHYLHSPEVSSGERWGLDLGAALVKRHAYLGAGEVFEQIARRGGAKQLEAWESARTAWKSAGHFERMVDAARERLAGEPASAAARAALAEALLERGDHEGALREYQVALKDPSVSSAEQAQIHLSSARILGIIRKPQEEEARILAAEATGAADPLALAFAKGSHAVNAGDGGSAVTHLERARQLARERGDALEEARILRYLGSAHYMLLGKPVEAGRVLKESAAIARREGWKFQATQAEAVISGILTFTGAHAQSLQLKRRGLECAIESGQWMMACNYAQNLALVAALHGQPAEAAKAAECAIGFAERTHQNHMAARAYEVLAIVSSQRSRPRESLRQLAQATEIQDGTGDWQAPLMFNRSRGIALWFSGAWRAAETVLRESVEEMLARHWPIDALPPLLGLAETLYHRRKAVEHGIIERARRECSPWRNRFAAGVLDLVEGIGALCDGQRERAQTLIDRAVKAFGKDVGLDFHLCAGLARARAAVVFEDRASHAAEVYHRALSNDRLRFAEEAAELLGDLSADAGNPEGAERWYQEARRVFNDRRSEWFDDPSMGEDLQRRDAALRDKAHPRDTASREEASFRRLLEIERRLNAQAELDPILKLVMDGLVDITGAERGYLVLVQGGKISVRARRNMDKRDPDSADLRFSRSVVEKVYKSGELFHSLNAPEDPRLTTAVSVKELGIRSILCLPLQTGNRRVGVVYLDNRHKGGVFETVNLERVEMFREKAALAMYRAILEDEVRELKRERDRLSEKIRLEDAVQRKPAAPKTSDRTRHAAFESLVGESAELASCLRILEKAAGTEAPVLIIGETGTGKELAARAVHEAGPRAGRTFLAVNCAAISATMLEAELFGNVRGAFTGADRDRAGLFQAAHRGTLFLDEIGEMSPDLQAKLLRALESKEVRKVGASTTEKVDVRIIAASNQDLTAMAKAGTFRSDLLYRLKVLQASLPPLRTRKEDIPLLVYLFLEKASGQKPRPKIESDAMRALMSHDWPGNVRELRHAVESLATLTEGRITAAEVRRQLQEPVAGPLSLHSSVEQTERDAIIQAIRTEPSISAAARKLGIVRSQLYRLMDRYKIRGSVENSVSH